MRTTVNIPDEVFRQVKSRAALEGIPLRELVEKALRLLLDSPTNRPALRKVSFPLHRSRRPGTLTVERVLEAQEQMQADEDLGHAGPR